MGFQIMNRLYMLQLLLTASDLDKILAKAIDIACRPKTSQAILKLNNNYSGKNLKIPS